MARILYGVAGEGLGHALRSSIVIDELGKKNDFHIITSGRAYKLLKERYENVTEIPGFFLNIKNNKLLSSNAITCVPPFLKNRIPAKNLLENVVKNFKPDIILNDFEPYLPWVSKRNNIPQISIDNINSMLRTDANFENFPWHLKQAAKLTTKLFSPHSDYFFIPSFFDAKTNVENASLVKPLISSQFFKYKNTSSKNNHFLVYQTTNSNSKLINELKQVNDKFLVYGFNKNEVDKNLEFKEFSKEGFLEDLVNSKGVIMNGSFSLMNEAIYLNKPVLSEPIKNYYEQNLNAHYLEKLGLGIHSDKITKEQIDFFKNSLNVYEDNMKNIKFDNNQGFFKELNNKIDELVNK